MAKIERIHTVRDDLTGEILSRSTNVIELKKLPAEPPYIKLYIEDLGKLHGLRPVSREVLLYVAAASGYDGIASITPSRKARIAATVGTTVNVVNNSLSECVKLKLLRRVALGEYEPNPTMFARGNWAEIRERQERFIAEFVYGPEGRTVMGTRKLTPDEAMRIDLEARGQLRMAL